MTGPNALVYRETVLKNKNSPTKVTHFFLVHQELFKPPSYVTYNFQGSHQGKLDSASDLMDDSMTR
jgi:hypothetical protein